MKGVQAVHDDRIIALPDPATARTRELVLRFHGVGSGAEDLPPPGRRPAGPRRIGGQRFEKAENRAVAELTTDHRRAFEYERADRRQLGGLSRVPE